MSKHDLTTIYIVRHGEAEHNVKFHEGFEPKLEYLALLTEKGKLQVYNLAKKLKKIHFDVVLSSDLLRAKQTAEILALERKLAVQTTERIRERSFSSYLKSRPEKTRDELEREMQNTLKEMDEKAKMTYKHSKDIESAEEGALRLITFLREIAIAYPEKTILVINHGNLMRSLLTHLGWAKYDELPQGAVENTGYVVLESDGVDFFIKDIRGANKKANAKRGW